MLYRVLGIAENFTGIFITWIFGPRDSTEKLLNFYLSELKWIFQNHMGKIISYDKVKYDTFLTTEGIFSHFAKAEDGCPG